MRPETLRDSLAAFGVDAPLEDTRRILGRLISEGGDDPKPRRRPVRREVMRAVREHCRWDRLEVVERVEDEADGFLKYLFRTDDGLFIEAVRIPLEKEGRFTVCLSSQVGCAMKCDFCATGRLGLTRNLETWEIVSTFLTVRDEAPGRVTGAVFMGQGEPFHNYEAVIEAAKVLSDPCGGRIDALNISISTVGLVPQIRRYTAEGHLFRLIVSLTSAISEKRRRLLPVAGSFSLEEVADAIRAHAEKTGKLQTVAWVLMAGVNDGPEEAAALKALLGDVRLRVNLIDVNDAREDGYKRASPEELARFYDDLKVLNTPVVRRYSGGKNKHAACGMLAATRFAEGAPSPEEIAETSPR